MLRRPPTRLDMKLEDAAELDAEKNRKKTIAESTGHGRAAVPLGTGATSARVTPMVCFVSYASVFLVTLEICDKSLKCTILKGLYSV